MAVVLDNLYSQENYLISKKLLDASHLRHEALSNNIANVETPGFKRRDLPKTFAVELRRAVGRATSGGLRVFCQEVLRIVRLNRLEWMETLSSWMKRC